MKLGSRICSPMLIVSAIALSLIGRRSDASEPLPVPERGFISSRPAQTWEEGLISGNGTIGANVLSRPLNERIIFTHERLFLPQGPPTMPPDTSARLFEIRKLIDRGLYKQASHLAFDLSGQDDFLYPDPFVPAFDLSVKMASDTEPSEYARSLDFQTGEATVQWTDQQTVFQRRLFVSRKDSVAVLSISGSKPGSVSCRLGFEQRQPSDKLDADEVQRSGEVFKESVTDIVAGADEFGLSYQNRFTKAYPGSIHGLEGVARVLVDGGTHSANGDGTIDVKKADDVLVLVDLQVLYDPDAPKVDAMKSSLANLPADYAKLLGDHAKIHGELFNRMRLDIGGGADHQRTTEELLDESSFDKLNRALVEKEFDAGRYNIISCTGELPPNLQGGWAGTYVPGWASDFTHNGNVPSAIAANLMGNMPELMLSYTTYIESLVPWLEVNAKHMFGARGIVLPSRSTTNGFNNALAPEFAGGFWVGGAGWSAHYFYDYYLYTGDREFLSEHALPFMEQAALFFEDYLYEGPDGKFVFSPTQSPENTPGNSNSQGSFNATMDVAIAKDLLTNLIAASNELGRNADKVKLWQTMLDKMPDYMIDEDGIIKEWSTPRLDNRDSHRHSSQLFPLYDGLPKEIDESPELRSAFKKSIEFKLDKHWKDNQRGFMSFGLVQLGQASTSLGESELAYHCLGHLVNRFWLNNLASMHNHRSLFNMDISGGMPAVIIKMLVASDLGKIKLLPAVPAEWPLGQIEGVLCRGAIEIQNLKWDGKQISVSLLADRSQSVVLELPSEIAELTVVDGKAAIAPAEHANQRTLSLEKGKPITLEILMK
ncbi:Glycosyl hydrolase family 65, N-terminal domain [Neorhodopirellula lusitana]|uniref:Glycosyl hydrolase family 65, N-terminal domain n=2 Tax=Neorhodopirellula lusitana TaxID=445327 RepID=A0ABY1QK19_9BACT|nr:Glycosyl hydrolase family 65, N-terminal domain [Neorhodopirellula lusitana]